MKEGKQFHPNKGSHPLLFFMLSCYLLKNQATRFQTNFFVSLSLCDIYTARRVWFVWHRSAQELEWTSISWNNFPGCRISAYRQLSSLSEWPTEFYAAAFLIFGPYFFQFFALILHVKRCNSDAETTTASRLNKQNSGGQLSKIDNQ